ncbi:hypothetical protein A7J57_05965 [Agrobacterium tumefaciens]|uniref:Uncharacterized protein n=1 Tax=Agrobacterium tumefaciens TaxID=358 RepID=A0A176XGG7_AGRTU|nr:hypothetical protein A7J57_05965 [Agrobacterium tumefaciens]
MWSERFQLVAFSPRGRRSRQRDEGARVARYGNVAPSSDPSGHLLPLGEKNTEAMSCQRLSRD